MSRADDLLAAPRGRGLCAAMRWTEDDVFQALRRTVDNAAYWQEPLDAAEIDAPDDGLRPIAERVLHSGEIEWWRAAAALDDQWYVDLQDARDGAAPPVLAGSATALLRWRDEEAGAAESMRETFRGGHPLDNVSGTWWSAPIVPGLPSTSRAVRRRGPAGLWLVEDELGWRRARCWPVRPTCDPRVYEVHGPDDWGQLARGYPLDVTDSRSADWARSTGRHGRWVIPDWAAVAVDYDAVHVSTWGYLTTAGRPVAVNGAASLLAGWSPDQTYWLTDCLELTGAPVDYVVDDEGGWERVLPAAAR